MTNIINYTSFQEDNDCSVKQVNALLEMIYQSTVDPSNWVDLSNLLLVNFREDLPYLKNINTLLKYIGVHINRALKISFSNQKLNSERQKLRKMIDSVAPSICVINRARMVLGINVSAENCIQESDVLSIINGRLVWSDKKGMEKLIAQAERFGFSSHLIEYNNYIDELLFLYIYKNDEKDGVFSLILFDNEKTVNVVLMHIEERFKLSEREMDILHQLMMQNILEDIAERKNISEHTVRHHLKNIYSKTGTHSQGELLALVLRSLIVKETVETHNAALLPHIFGLAHTHIIKLKDNRQISFAELGDPVGIPVLYFHALNGSRLELLIHSDELMKQGIRLICIDRPGYGYSTFYEFDTYDEYAQDLGFFLDHLRLEMVAILSFSAGSPYALACAAALPDRISSVQCTGSICPFEYQKESSSPVATKMITQLFRLAPSLLRPALELVLRGQTVDSLFQGLLERRSELFQYALTDIEFISHPERVEYFIGFTIESLRQGTKAWAKEGGMINRSWQIDWHSIRCPIVFWHGSDDKLYSVEMLESFSKTLPTSRLEVIPEETHLLIFRRLSTVLKEIF